MKPIPMRIVCGLWLGLCLLSGTLPVTAGALVDPTRPAAPGRPTPAVSTAPRHVWTLDSTLVAPDRRVAVINGTRVSEGEVVDGARVIEIRELDVVIQTAGRRLTLNLLPDIVQRQP